jgi:hypothetical protein
MNKAALLSVLVVAVQLAVGVIAEAQQPTKVPRVGFLSLTSRSSGAVLYTAFLQGLQRLGCIEGKNVIIESRWADGKTDRLLEFAAEFVRLKVERASAWLLKTRLQQSLLFLRP